MQQYEIHAITSRYGYWKQQSYNPKGYKKWKNIRQKELIRCLWNWSVWTTPHISCNGATAQRAAQQDISNDTQHHDKHGETMQVKLNLLEAEREREREQLQATIDDLRTRLDRSEKRITALLPAPAKRSWWSWK
jgi:hypothetical protein